MAGISTNDKNNDHFFQLRVRSFLILTTWDVPPLDFYMAHILLSQNYQFSHLVFFQLAQSCGAVVLSHFCFHFINGKFQMKKKEVVEVSWEVNTNGFD